MHGLGPPRPEGLTADERGRPLAGGEPLAEVTAAGALRVMVVATADPSLPAAQENVHG